MVLFDEKTHEWVLVEFVFGSWTECICGFVPQSQEEMDAHG
jgi:hypothetical protein